MEKVPLLQHRIQQSREDIKEEQKKRQESYKKREGTREREIIISNNKDEGYTLTTQEKAELETQSTNERTKAIQLERAGLLINATGEEITGVST